MNSGVLSIIPFIGVVALLAGVVASLATPKRLVLLFVLSPVLSECYVGIAGSMRGQVRGSASLIPFLVFSATQVLLSGFLIYRLKRSRFAACALGLFCVSYAFIAVIVGGMAFADDWI